MRNRTCEDLAIIVLNYDGLDDTLKCLESLHRQTAEDFSIFVVDNASKEAPDVVTRRYPKIILIKRESNGGWAGGNNTGAGHALKKGCRNIVFLNNDTIVAENFVERLAKALDAHPDFGILGPMICPMNEPNKILTEGVLFNRQGYNGFFEDQKLAIKVSEPPNVEKTDIVNGCCLVARREVFDKIGLFDERFFLVCEESDFCLRAAQAGFKCGIITEPLVWHKHGAAFSTGYDPKAYYNARNLWLLLNKHAGKVASAKKSIASKLQYLRTVRYMYCEALESNAPGTNQAVIDGVADAWTGKFGARQNKRNGIIKILIRVALRFACFISQDKTIC